MIFEYISSMYAWSFKNHNKLQSYLYNLKDVFQYKKLLQYIGSHESNYDLLLDMSNLFALLIKIYGFDIMMDMTKPYISHYSTAPYRDSSSSAVKHSLVTVVDDESYSYTMEITYHTVNNLNVSNRQSVSGYHVTITNKGTKISNGYSLYSDEAHKFPELDKLISSLIRISFKYIISSVRKYILDNHKVTSQEAKFYDFFLKRNIRKTDSKK